ncbi:PREDICTED: transmembrane protein 158 [Crocodylus porosus]|uniref:transmembrane protein 158 n=1 Tax=Crocodylus porosus TaxID=8502 RepID=UPI000939C4CD|nr:PREDICTED: transmembrane protein 158 [Crocodylus porosus]
MLLPPALLLLLLAAAPPPCRGWEQRDLYLPPGNSSSRALPGLALGLGKEAEGGSGPSAEPFPSAAPRGRPEPGPGLEPEPEPEPEPAGAQQQQQQQVAEPHCNISVQRQMLSSLLVRWSRPLGIQCDLLLFSTNSHGRAFFSAAFHRVGPPLLIEHLGLAAGGAPQDLRLCVGCSWVRGRRIGRLRGATAPSSSSSSLSYPEPGQLWLQGEPLNFCCLDFSLEELKGEPGWRLNRKPIESTLVACFMTLVIIVWSVAALIWPVPIIAGFLPNGMEQRRSTSASATAGAAAK